MLSAQPLKQWVKRFDGKANGIDHVVASTIDGSGNTYVVGYSEGSSTSTDIVAVIIWKIIQQRFKWTDLVIYLSPGKPWEKIPALIMLRCAIQVRGF